MKFFTISAIAAGSIAAALGLAGAANAAPAGPSAAQAVGQLQAEGYHVILNKIGNGPLDQCQIKSVRPGQTFTRMDSGVPGAMDDVVTTVTARTVYIDVTC